jgi:lysophospholipase L1-like esterase
MRLFAALVTTLVTAGLALLLFPQLRGGGAPPPLQVLELRPEDADFTRWREFMEAQYPPIPLAPYADSTLARSSLALELLQKIYPPLRTPSQVWDPFLGFHRPPNLDRMVPWQEHPNGEWRLRTNSNGQRMDFDPTLAQDALVIGVAGDSHFDGVCNNSESLAGLLQKQLAQTFGATPLEIVNTANGGHSLYEYLGAMEMLLGDDLGAQYTEESRQETRLDAMVVCVYGGNDFTELLKLAHYFERSERPQGWGIDNVRIAPWRKTHLASIAQAVEGLVYFRNNPSEVQLALARAIEISEELLRHAERRKVPLLFVYLPSALESEPTQHERKHTELLQDLDITAADKQIFFGMGDKYLQGLRKRGAEVLDLRTVLGENSGAPLFWTKDLHLNPKGHLAVAKEVRTWLEGKLP